MTCSSRGVGWIYTQSSDLGLIFLLVQISSYQKSLEISQGKTNLDKLKKNFFKLNSRCPLDKKKKKNL